MFPFIEDVGGGHIVRQETDLHFGRDELHGHIIIHPVNGYGCVPVDPAGNAVHEAFIQPGTGLGHACLHAGAAVPLQRDFPDAGMVSSIIGTDIIPEKPLEFFQGMDSVQVQGIKPGFLQGPPLAFDFLYECSYKRSYTTDFFIRIFSEKY